MQPGKRMFENETSPMNFLNTPIRTRNQLRLESRAGSSMVSPFPQKRPRIGAGADFKDIAVMGNLMNHYQPSISPIPPRPLMTR